MIIDGHCHVWPDAVAERALAGSVSDLPRHGDGRVASLLSAMDSAGIDRAVCLGVANTPDRVESANRFAGSLDRSRFIGFGSIHPGLSPEENIESLRANGLRGAKVHPYFQQYALDDPRLWEIFSAMEGEFAVIAHVGAAGSDPGLRCTPEMLACIARAFPRLSLVACHFGGYRMLDDADRSVVGLPGVYLDTSWPPSLAELDIGRIRSLIERHGPERVVFASDWPMADPLTERQTIEQLGFDEATTRGILGENLQRLLAIP